jgi:hypothetical protein
MKKAMLIPLLALMLTGCYEVKYNTFTKAEVSSMMKKFKDLEETGKLPAQLKKWYSMDAKIINKLCKIGIKIRYITGVIYPDDYKVKQLQGQQGMVLQLKYKDGNYKYIDFMSITTNNAEPMAMSATGLICPPPDDCITDIEQQ